MRYLCEITVVNRKNDDILLDAKAAATTESEAILKAASGSIIDYKKVDVVARKIARTAWSIHRYGTTFDATRAYQALT